MNQEVAWLGWWRWMLTSLITEEISLGPRPSWVCVRPTKWWCFFEAKAKRAPLQKKKQHQQPTLPHMFPAFLPTCFHVQCQSAGMMRACSKKQSRNGDRSTARFWPGPLPRLLADGYRRSFPGTPPRSNFGGLVQSGDPERVLVNGFRSLWT